LSSFFASSDGLRSDVTSDATPQKYVMKIWRIEGDTKTFLWSIEDPLREGEAPGVLYPSLSAPSLRAKVSSFPSGTTLSFHFYGGGSVETTDPVIGKGYKEFQDFSAFLKSRGIVFDFRMSTD